MKKRKCARGISLLLLICGASLLLLNMYWLGILHPVIFDRAGNYRTDGVFKELSPAIASFCKQLDDWVLYLLIASLAGFAGLIAFGPRVSKDAGSSWRESTFGTASLAIGVLANLLVLLFSSDFFFVRPGEAIRPMGWAVLMLFLAGATLVLSLPLSLISLVKEKRRLAGIIGLVLGVTPLPFAIILLRGLAAIIGFSLAE